jgi:predicted permease
MSSFFEQLLNDLRYGARSFAKAPGFTMLAVLSLATGIMAVTVIYSVVYAVILDPFPYKDVDRLMSVRVSNAAQRGGRLGYSVDQFLEIAERSTIFDGVIASTISDVLWSSDGDPMRLRGNVGTFNTFEVMGVPPLLGRTPLPSDAHAGAPPVVVLGYRFWQRQFGGDPNVLGRHLQLNGTDRIVIGVMPKRFMWRGADVYLPVTFQRGRIVEGVRTVHLLGRLKPGVTEAQAEADLRPIIEDLKRKEPTEFPDQWRVGLLSFKETFRSGIVNDLWVLFGAVGLLLLIACANVSNLLLSRAAARQREMTVRAALGASRHRIVRQLLTESVMLALAAGAIGVALAYAGLPAILAIVPPNTIPDESEIVLNRSVLLFALVLSAVTSIVFGLVPALHGARRDLTSALREAGRGLSGSASQAIVRKSLVVAEVALAFVLLAGSSLLVRTFVAMAHVPLGVAPERIVTFRVPLPVQRYPDAAHRIAFFQSLVPRLASVPGVAAVGLNTGMHPLGNMWTTVNVAGMSPSTDPVVVHQVNDGYFAALGIHLASGRFLTRTDVDGVQPVALVNERFVQTRLEGRDPLGLTIALPRLRQPPFSMKSDALSVIGVVRDTPNNGLADPVMPEVYMPFTATGVPERIAVRTAMDPAGVTRALVSQVYALDPNQPVTSVQTLEDMLRTDAYATPRFNLALLSVFAIVGIVLAVVGIYGVMSNAVAQQQHEIGVRMALGAHRGTIVRMVILRGAQLLAIGLVLGLIGSIVAARLLARQVWNISPFDPIAFLIVSGIVLAAGLQACLWPARRAARTDPILALRQE